MGGKAKAEEEAPFVDEWESEYDGAFKWMSEAERKAMLEAEERELRRKNRKRGGLRRSSKYGQATRKTSSNEDWVFVQSSDAPIALDGTQGHVVVVPPTDQLPSYDTAPKGSLRMPIVTRNYSDTKFNRVFKRPLPHNYGRGNTCPVNDSNYLKTFNLKAAMENPANVYESTFRAKDLQDELKKNHYDIMECLDDPENDEADIAVPPLTRAEPPKPEVFGRANKPRAEEPTMFEILSWQ